MLRIISRESRLFFIIVAVVAFLYLVLMALLTAHSGDLLTTAQLAQGKLAMQRAVFVTAAALFTAFVSHVTYLKELS